MTTKVYKSYKDIEGVIEKALPSIKTFKPDYLLAIGNGGLVPASMLRKYLNIPIYVVRISLYKPGATSLEKDQNPIIHQWLNKNAYNALVTKRVLIVDDIDDTGTTLQFCIDNLKKTVQERQWYLQSTIAAMATFVVYRKQKPKRVDSTVKAFVGKTIQDEWLVFPWESDA